jgi:glutamate-1-semialdehyde 2,1-aminomutase
MLGLLRSENPYKRMETLASYWTQGLQDAAIKAGVSLRIQSFASMITPFFCDHPVTDYAAALKADKLAYGRFFNGMLRRGVYLPPAQWEAMFVSYAHTDRELDLAIKAAAGALTQ